MYSLACSSSSRCNDGAASPVTGTMNPGKIREDMNDTGTIIWAGGSMVSKLSNHTGKVSATHTCFWLGMFTPAIRATSFSSNQRP